MKVLYDKAVQNPWLIFVPLLLGGSGTAVKFGMFDPLLKPMYQIIYHQKVLIYMEEGLGREKASEEAEFEMLRDGYWKPRGL